MALDEGEVEEAILFGFVQQPGRIPGFAWQAIKVRGGYHCSLSTKRGRSWLEQPPHPRLGYLYIRFVRGGLFIHGQRASLYVLLERLAVITGYRDGESPFVLTDLVESADERAWH